MPWRCYFENLIFFLKPRVQIVSEALGLGAAKPLERKRGTREEKKFWIPWVFTIIEILYTVETDKIDKIKRAKIVVPKSLVSEFLNKAHGSLHSGHPGEKRTYNNLSKFAYWEGMRRDVGVPRYFTICLHFHVWIFVFTKTETLVGHSDAVWPMDAAANPFSFGHNCEVDNSDIW